MYLMNEMLNDSSTKSMPSSYGRNSQPSQPQLDKLLLLASSQPSQNVHQQNALNSLFALNANSNFATSQFGASANDIARSREMKENLLMAAISQMQGTPFSLSALGSSTKPSALVLKNAQQQSQVSQQQLSAQHSPMYGCSKQPQCSTSANNGILLNIANHNNHSNSFFYSANAGASSPNGTGRTSNAPNNGYNAHGSLSSSPRSSTSSSSSSSAGSVINYGKLPREQNQKNVLNSKNTSAKPLAGTSGTGSGANATGGNSSRYKTELCRPFEESGFCKYSDKCQYAHGQAELRSLARHPKYKTELCRTFHTTGFCPYGPRCHFIHNNDAQSAKSKDVLLLGGSFTGTSASSNASNGLSLANGNDLALQLGSSALISPQMSPVSSSPLAGAAQLNKLHAQLASLQQQKQQQQMLQQQLSPQLSPQQLSPLAAKSDDVFYKYI